MSETQQRRVHDLDVDTCLQLLAQRRVGRLAFVEEGGHPVVLPVNYLLDRGSVLIRTGEGSKLAAAVRKARVAFEVDEIDDDLQIGWSVVVKGIADELW
jgi:nitroimidazol reductase NimA-like FMN-containing flavoprotein (pyridoxamine 5'-phosphate oxidase superfamily)